MSAARRLTLTGMDSMFYYFVDEDDGERLDLPRTTKILDIIDKSAPLMGWSTKLERRSMLAMLEDVLTQPGERDYQTVYEQVMQGLSGKRAWVREMDKAREIGNQAHALIRWHVYKQLGADPGDEPQVSDPALQAVVAWLDWSRDVDFTPIHAELVVYCPYCMFAGTLDCVAKVQGKVTMIDWKTGKAVYPESFLQNVAYRHCASRDGIQTEGGLIVRLPKTAEDPTFEAVPVPNIPFHIFLAAKWLWMWQRQMDQEPYGPRMTACPLRAAR